MKEVLMKLYRLLTGPDDESFCRRVEQVLNEGWALHGSPSLTFNGTQVIAGQAITKTVEGPYKGFIHLKDLESNPEGPKPG